MGCTSSAPNMAESNTSDNCNDAKHLETSKETKKEELKNDNHDDKKNEIVLPICDNLDQNIQISRNNSSLNVPNQQVENDNNKKNDEEQIENPKLIINQQNQNELQSLKEVVNQVVLENIFQSTEYISTLAENESSTDENVQDKENVQDEENVIELQEIYIKEDLIDNNVQEEVLDETVSPSQSESSRATRWEALADIAAELPPSLAVDPLTGQIYSLAK